MKRDLLSSSVGGAEWTHGFLLARITMHMHPECTSSQLGAAVRDDPAARADSEAGVAHEDRKLMRSFLPVRGTRLAATRPNAALLTTGSTGANSRRARHHPPDATMRTRRRRLSQHYGRRPSIAPLCEIPHADREGIFPSGDAYRRFHHVCRRPKIDGKRATK